jgi:hypothetical protein
MHENQANKKLLYEKQLDEEAIEIAAAKDSYQQALDNLAISSASAQSAIAPRGQREAIALPEDFPESLPPFRFKLGARVRWKPMPSTDWGTIAGMEYAIHQPRNSWQPRYKVHLDPDSPSRAWIDSDWAWEWDLEPEPEQQNRHSTRCQS